LGHAEPTIIRVLVVPVFNELLAKFDEEQRQGSLPGLIIVQVDIEGIWIWGLDRLP